MKAFRGTAMAGLALLGVWGLTQWLSPERAPEDSGQEQVVQLFAFDKSDLIRVEIQRPDDELILQEEEQGWVLEGLEVEASRSMVNRVRHQLHQLESRAKVVEQVEDPNLYGLDEARSVTVTLSFRDGKVQRFRAGDPNPSSVSYYIQPLPGEAVYVVKKSAVDYYRFTRDDFRERRFASLDSQAADRLEIQLRDQPLRVLSKVADRRWELLEPQSMPASRNRVRGLMGRVTALKAQSFEADLGGTPGPEQLAPYGLDDPRARIQFHFSGRDPLVLRVGDPAPQEGDLQSLAYMCLEGEWTVYRARDALLEDYMKPLEDLRDERLIYAESAEVKRLEVRLQGGEPAGTASLLPGVDGWTWGDGKPTSGSTPSRVIDRVLELESMRAEVPAGMGWAQARAELSLELKDGSSHRIELGPEAPPVEEEEFTEYRDYARVDDGQVVVVTHSLMSVLEDLIREQGRKAERDEEVQSNQEAREQAREEEP